MNTGPKLEFTMRAGWTLRQLATALVREWLPPLRAVPAGKGNRWAVQLVVDAPGGPDAQLWEPGISTLEHETRLNRREICWYIRARTGRGAGINLVHLAMSSDRPDGVTMQVCADPFPDGLFDADKVSQELKVPATLEPGAFFAAVMASNGFPPIAT